MKSVVLIVAALGCACGAAVGQSLPSAQQGVLEQAPQSVPHPAGPFEASEISFAEQKFAKRALVIFANSPEDLNFQRQLEMVRAGLDQLAARDVVVVLDTDPSQRTEWRRYIRPTGFSLVQLDKDFTPVFRKPLPWSLREITHSIDRLESRRQELAQKFPSGR